MAVNRSTAVGGFVLGGLVLGVVAILAFGGARFFTPTLRLVVYFQDSVAGLSVGAPVTLRGVKIGSVRRMKVFVRLPDLQPLIPVYLQIEPGQVSWTNGILRANAPDIEEAIKAGLRAQLATDSLVTGQLSVNLDFHPEVPATFSGIEDDVPEIPSMPSDLQHLKNEIADLKLPELAEKARAALDGVLVLVGELTGKLGPVADAARVTLETATDSVRTLQTDSSRTLASIDKLATSTQEQVQSTGKQLDQVLASTGKAVTRAQTLVDSLNDLTSPRAPLRGDLEAAIRDLAASASSLRNFSRELERNPSALLTGRSSK
jgi:paraquat-inducible protein B